MANSATLSPTDPGGIRPALRLGSTAFLLLLVALAAFPHSSAAQVVERPQLRDIETDRELMMYRVYHTITSEGELVAEQYKMAATLFRNVIAQFPNSYEAHANLGYAQLMDYMGQFEPADIAAFDIGHLVVGAFTRRPESMEPEVRGINAQLWFQATSSLQAALRLNPGLAEAKANLGIAYLVQPQGGSNTAEARRLLAEAVSAAQYNANMDPRTKAAIFINAGVAELAEGLLQESFDHMTSATG